MYLPRWRGRYIPVAVRRAVEGRDQGRCTHVDETGRRCEETSLLEFHHEVPYARGGAATVETITLRCRAHNALAAERDFGTEFVRAKRGATPV